MRTQHKTLWLTLGFLGLLVLAWVASRFGLLPGWEDPLQGAQEALERRDFRKASLQLQKALETRPQEPAIRLLAAQTARRQGDFDRAWKLLAQCDQKEAVALERSLIAVQGGDRAETERLLASAFQNPRSPETPLILEAFLIGFVGGLPPVTRIVEVEQGSEREQLLAQGRRAVELWLENTSGAGDQVQGLVWRGRIREVAGDHPGALADFRAGLERDPEHFEARFFLAESLAQEAPAEAARQLQILYNREPASRPVRFALATVRRGLGQVEVAGKLLDELLTERRDDLPVQIERVKLALDRQENEDAEGRARRAVAQDPSYPEAQLVLSRCLRAAGKTEEANKSYEEFLRLEAQRKSQHESQPKK
jgi:tetratricopeptide (TPR) repeat protein